jgi:hypothetical protein
MKIAVDALKASELISTQKALKTRGFAYACGVCDVLRVSPDSQRQVVTGA